MGCLVFTKVVYAREIYMGEVSFILVCSTIFEQPHLIESRRQGTLITLPKSKKSPDPPANMWTNVLFKSIRDKIDHISGPY